MISSTYTLLAKDPATGHIGIAVASKFLAVGAAVPFLRPSVGGVATQHFHEPRLAFAILESLEAGVEAKDATERALKQFGQIENRQVAVLAALPPPGRPAIYVHTGTACEEWCGQRVGEDLIVLGNTLAGEQVLAEAERAFRACASPHLAERLVEGLLAADRAGGDRRGKQAASLKVVGNQGFQPPIVDLRVDDHPDAPLELHRLWILHRKLMGTQIIPAPLESPAARAT